jgi:hypothetical protein
MKALTRQIAAAVVISLSLPFTVSAAPKLVVNPPAEPESYRALAADWWQWTWDEGLAQVDDMTGEFCDLNQPEEGVWFLAGTFGVEGVTRSCTIPSGRQLFFPLINNAFFCPFPNETIDELRAGAAANLPGDPPGITLEASIDGVPVENILNRVPPRGLDLLDLRVQSEIFSLDGYPLPVIDIDEDGDGVPEYEQYPCPNVFVSDGAWVLVEPLRPGHHTIEFAARRPDGFALSVTYLLTVLDGKGKKAVAPAGLVDQSTSVNRFTQEMIERRQQR